MTTTQREAFINGEANLWYERNADAMSISPERLDSAGASDDSLVVELERSCIHAARVLEIGCSNGWRLEVLRRRWGAKCFGLDPSDEATKRGRASFPFLELMNGTADVLPYETNSFDLVIFGFCLYLCDRQDLFKIACEADRVLENHGFIAILDFQSPLAFRNEYAHRNGLHSYKMDYSKMFSWNPAYTLSSRTVKAYDSQSGTINANNLIGINILRKVRFRNPCAA